MTIKTAKELAAAAEAVAKRYKTLYVMGCIGAPMTDANKKKYTGSPMWPYNQKSAPKKAIMAADSETFGFDCICLVKSLLWGWSGNKHSNYGGARYQTNGVPDINADTMIEVCEDVTTDFSKIEVGEYLWMKGHCGIYIGNGLAVECTPRWKNCVQITAVQNVTTKSGYNSRKWSKHGKLPYVSYGEKKEEPAPAPAVKMCTVQLPVLQIGAEGDAVESLQRLLIAHGYNCGDTGADGIFGPKTENAVEAFQEDNNLGPDGAVGPETWPAVIGKLTGK